MAKQQMLKKNMRLFGLPYQFNKSVDPRVDAFSTTVGRKFAENIILDAPVISIIPGKPKYLAGAKKSDQRSITQSMISMASGSFDSIREAMNNKTTDDVRFYDFERSYTEYMKYVNILCRSCAAFLELDELIDGESCQRYDYRRYRWTTENLHSVTQRATSNVVSGIGSKFASIANTAKNTLNKKLPVVNVTDTDESPTSPILKYTDNFDDDDGAINDLLTNYNFVQFFIDSDISFNESMGNQTGSSMIKDALSQGSNLFKELSFAMDSAGIEGMENFMTESLASLTEGLGNALGNINTNLTGALGRVLDLGSNVVKGENIIMPDVYQNSTYDKSYTFTVHLKTPYGTKFGYFLDICVPLMHLIALGLPKQTNSNSYASPFLVKAYCEGIFTCNMGMVTSITVNKGIDAAFSVDGLPTEVDVSVTIADLYSDLSMSPQSEPLLFANNSSLVEYLATTCGLSLITPNLDKRWDMLINNVSNSLFDVGTNIVSGITEAADKLLMDFFGLNKW